MKKIIYPIIVEGKYDKIKICSLFNATVITTGGFSIFNNNEKIALLKKLALSAGKIRFPSGAKLNFAFLQQIRQCVYSGIDFSL